MGDNDQEHEPKEDLERKKRGRNRKIVSEEDFGTKKRKMLHHEVMDDSVRVCKLCNKEYNCRRDFKRHFKGKKHSRKVEKLVVPDNAPVNGRQMLMNQQAALYSTNASTQNNKPKKKKTVAQSVYCDICKITCNTQEMYNIHVSGKKHNRKIQNLIIGDRLIQFIPVRNNLPDVVSDAVSSSHRQDAS